MKKKSKLFEQHLTHFDIEDESKIHEYLDNALPLIGFVVMDFNGLEKSLDKIICEIFTDRTDAIGLIVLNKMNYSAKVDLFKRFSDDFHICCEKKIEGFEKLIENLKECGRLRNLVVHADWENTNDEGYTYINFKQSKNGMEQEYMQFTEDSLHKILDLIISTETNLHNYWDKRNEELYRNN